MCEANVYLYRDDIGKEELFMEQVDKVVPQNGELYLENIFGQRKTIAARIRELSLVDHRVILEIVKESEAG
ncbi:MAG TPA: CooT family nickel-binding protein [Methylomusa anaerophila]|uniref:Putative RNA-binding protein n=1 Tax=Methylomusa anaerophila TaxID=1930071 RepID=A0A348AGG7_9FIRM|nr:CooT family nickel-binding protein [Methylomusa anaerophila]BBB90165.1 putative RNA-binding protein [Methylomusa anaerophila]HML88109.1 CooT family nickel-binding protein [Methylomusa anaerophila]